MKMTLGFTGAAFVGAGSSARATATRHCQAENMGSKILFIIT